MTTSDDNQVGRLLEGSLKAWERRLVWKRCPWCGEEDSRLRAYSVFIDGARFDDSACVRCVETVSGLAYVGTKFEVPSGIEITFPKIMRYRGEPLWRSSIAQVAYGSFKFLVGSDGFRVWTLEVGKSWEEKRDFDNIPDAWLYLRDQFRNPRATFVTESWGKAKPKRKPL